MQGTSFPHSLLTNSKKSLPGTGAGVDKSLFPMPCARRSRKRLRRSAALQGRLGGRGSGVVSGLMFNRVGSPIVVRLLCAGFLLEKPQDPTSHPENPKTLKP